MYRRTQGSCERPFPEIARWRLEAWKETLLVGRFASPTATGVLFSMLSAAGLSATWLFKKARILVIFDDLDTVLLLIPLQMLMIGWAWQLCVAAVLMIFMLGVAYVWLHRVDVPFSWPWVLGYAAAITVFSKAVFIASRIINEEAPIHIEVLLPAFVLGAMIRRPPGSNPHRDDVREGHQEGPENPHEQKVSTISAAIFMLLVGLNVPPISVGIDQPSLGAGSLVKHVLLVTVLANLGKMVLVLFYGHEAHWRERLALAFGMCPRGEMGAGILVLSVSYGISGPILTVAMLSLVLNLLLTGPFIFLVKTLMRDRAIAFKYPHLTKNRRAA